jgi:hypothetical protein
MQKNNNFIGRRFLLAATDALVAFFCAMLLMKYAPQDPQIPVMAAMVLATVISLTMSGAYVHVLRKPLAWHQYSAGLAACSGGVTTAIVLWTYHVPGKLGQALFATATLFLTLLAVRGAMLFCYRSFAGNKLLWVIADDAIAALHLAAKVRSHACCYEVGRCSGPPLDDEDLEAELAPFDAVL